MMLLQIEWNSVITGLLTNFTLTIILIYCYSKLVILTEKINKMLNSIITGICFGIFAIMAINSPISINKGVFVDSRLVIISLAGYFGSWISGIITIIAAGSFRLYMGGIGAVPGTFMVILSGLSGIFFQYKIHKRIKNRFIILVLLGLVQVIISQVLLIMLPPDIIITSIQTFTIPILIYHPCAVLILGTFLHQEKNYFAMQQEIKESEAKFKTLFASSPDPVFLIDRATGKIIDANEKCSSVYGYCHKEFISMNNADVSGEPGEIEKKTKEPGDYILVRFHKKKDGTVFPVEITANTIVMNNKKVIIATIRDISSRMKAESELVRSQRFLKEAQRIAHLGIWELDLHTKEISFSDEVYSIFGIDRDTELNIENIRRMILVDDEKYIDKAISNAKSGFVGKGSEFRIYNKEKGERDVIIRGNLISNTAKEPVKVIGTIQDITEAKSLEKQLRYSEKMQAVGQLASRIAHDFNNLLNIILTHTELLQSRAAPHTSTKENLDTIFITCMRARELINQILIFSRQSTGKRVPLYLSDITEQALKLLRSSLPASITMNHTIHKETCPVNANSVNLYTVITNLCTNAVHAMNKKGSIEISCKEIFLEKEEPGYFSTIPPGEYAVLTVKDTGPGIDKKAFKHIFEPFFSTKDKNEGIGLGLSVVHGIIKDHDGEICVNSIPGEGTAFSIYLPKTKDKVIVSKDTGKEPVSSPGKGTILFIDDEDFVLQGTSAILRIAGYTVFATTKADEALQLVLDTDQRFDVIITDQAMPVMTGIEFTKKIRKINQDIPIILCSGFLNVDEEKEAFNLGVNYILNKPFSKKDLINAIREVSMNKNE